MFAVFESEHAYWNEPVHVRTMCVKLHVGACVKECVVRFSRIVACNAVVQVHTFGQLVALSYSEYMQKTTLVL